MPVVTHEFVGELHRRGQMRGSRITHSEFCAAHGGLHASQLSAMLKCPALPDDFMVTLNRIAPADGEGVEVRGLKPAAPTCETAEVA